MSYDVSIYSVRTQTGYLSTPTGGTSRSIGSSPYSTTSSGGGATGVVRTTGVQRASGEKYWDASANFTYDVSIGQDLFVVGRNINDWDDAQDVSIAWLLNDNQSQDVSIAWLNANKWTDASLSRLNDVSLGGIGSAQDSSALVYQDGYWTYGTGGTQINALNDIGDVSVGGVSVDQVLTWKGTYWEAADVSGLSVTYAYVDGSLLARDAIIAVHEASIGTMDGSIKALFAGEISSLNDLNDVSILSVANEDVLLYNSTDSEWKNEATSDASLYFQYILSSGTKSSGAPGYAGEWSYDASYLYICTGTDTWIRILGIGGY